MIQILGLRPFYDKKKEDWTITDNTFFREKWRATSLENLFKELPTFLAAIPVDQHWNLFYTVANCTEKKRDFKEQNVLMFDIDKMNLGAEDSVDAQAYARVVGSVLGIKPEDMSIVFSGNGLHFIIQLAAPITDPLFFGKHRHHYSAICLRIQMGLAAAGLAGEPDTKVFDARRIMRLPGTENRKEGKPTKQARLIQCAFIPYDLDIVKLSGLPQVEASDHINPATLKKRDIADNDAVLAGCDFLKHCKENPNQISEAEWYASLSILGRMDRKIAHEYSAGHNGYSMAETDSKIDQALAASGPRTCKNINALWGKCAGCPNFEKVPSPITIQGETYIKTKNTGFHSVHLTETGQLKIGKPQYEDLRKFFEQQNPYVTLKRACLTYTGTHYTLFDDEFLENFAHVHFEPIACNKMRSEFKGLVLASNPKPASWFGDTTHRKINFKNGVLDLKTMELVAHSPAYGFRYCLPYDFNASAKAPLFERFLDDIMLGRKNLVNVLLEYMGYSFSGDKCWAQKALIMTGHGANGKSTLIDVMKALAGETNHSSLTLGELRNDANRALMDGKLFNLAEETPSHAMMESSLFKNLVSGGDTTMKLLYKQPYKIANRTKLMMACNDLPHTTDTSHGFFRRLLLIPFEARFQPGDGKYDAFILDKLIDELPGIFNLVLAGYHRLIKQKAFSEAAEITTKISEYRESIDNVRAWLGACVEVVAFDESTSAVSINELYANYAIYCENHGILDRDRLSSNPFAKRIAQIIPEYAKRKGRAKLKGERTTTIKGVILGEGDF